MFVRPYAVAGYVRVPLELAASGLFAKTGDYSHVDGDTMIAKDANAFANINTDPVPVANTGGNQASAVWHFAYNATEATCAEAQILTSDVLLKDQLSIIQFMRVPIIGTLDASTAAGDNIVTLDTATTPAVADVFNGWMCRFTYGDGREQELQVLDYAADHTLTLNHDLVHGVTLAETDYILYPPSPFVTPS